MKKIQQLVLITSLFIFIGFNTTFGQLECNSNVVASIGVGTNTSPSKVKIYAESLISGSTQDLPNLMASRDGVTYGPFIEYFCEDIGTHTFYVRTMDDTSEEICIGEILIEDKLGPVIDVIGPVYLSLNGQSSVELTTDMIEAYSYDNCSVTASLSQSTFTAVGTYSVIYTVTDPSNNTASASLDIIVIDSYNIACNNNLFVALDENGEAELTPDMILEGSIPANSTFLMSVNGGPFLSAPVVNCDNQGTESTEVVIQEVETGNTCWSNLTIEDKTSPTPYLINGLTLSLAPGNTIVVPPSAIDVGSFDNCGITNMTLEPNTFSEPGQYEVTLTVFDAAGNSDFGVSLLTIVGGNGPAIECISLSTAVLPFSGEVELWAEDFVENHEDFDNFEMSTSFNGTYTETITFDCAETQTGTPFLIWVRAYSGDEFSECPVSLTIVDNIAPIVVLKQSLELILVDGFVYLTPEDIDNGTYDECGEVALSLSQSVFTTDDIGVNIVTLTAVDESGNSNSSWAEVTVIGSSGLAINCVDDSEAVMPFSGEVTVNAEDFVQNNADFESIEISTSANGPYTETLTLDCADTQGNTPFQIFVRAYSADEVSTCFSNFTIIDNIPPVTVAEPAVTLTLQNGSATLTTSMVDDGSYDFCGAITFSLSQSLFTTADLGENQVALTVTDQSGNYNQVWTIVTVVNGSPCGISSVAFPSDIFIYDLDGVEDNLSVENLQSFYGYTFPQVYPTTPNTCNNIHYTYEDVVIPLINGVKIIRTFTAIDWIISDIRTHVQIVQLSNVVNDALACNAGSSVIIGPDGVQLFPIDLLDGDNYDFSILELVITDQNGDIVPDNLVTTDYLGQILTYQITDTETGNSCWGSFSASDDNIYCPIDFDEDVTLPLSEINLANNTSDLSQYTPENLVAVFGFDESEVNVIVNGPSCSIVGIAIEDDVFNYSDNNFKIVRHFTLVDWAVYQPSNNDGIWYFTQTINVGIDPNSLICDVLPHNAPVGDCDSGHTLEDDVEWPANIMIADYRITPEELIEFSDIDVKDARPEFFNSPEEYTATYLDILIEITSTSLTLARVWKATHSAYDISWNYSQAINIDISDFENLVTINTTTNRAMPGVIINNAAETDMQGNAQVEGEITTIEFDDIAENGITLADLLVIQRHILGLGEIDPESFDAADVNGDGDIKSSDLVELRKNILGVTDDNGWVFFVNTLEDDVLIKPKAVYSAYKKGDIDNDVLLPGDDPIEPTSEFIIDDVLLNNGETYQVPVILDSDLLMFGLEIRMKVNSDLIKLNDVEFPLAFSGSDFHLNEEDELVITMSDPTHFFELQAGEEEVVAYLNITAEMNGLLNTALDLTNRRSYAVDQNFELIYMSGELEDMIGTGTNSPELASVTAYPNPTTEYLIIDHSGVSLKGDLLISIYNTNGQLVASQSNINKVDVRRLESGNYFYKVNIGDHQTIGKFIVIK